MSDQNQGGGKIKAQLVLSEPQSEFGTKLFDFSGNTSAQGLRGGANSRNHPSIRRKP